MICKIPEASDDMKDRVKHKAKNAKRRKRSATDEKCLPFTILVKLDGVEQEFTISYCVDPTLEEFDGVKLFSSEDQFLYIKVYDVYL